MPIDNKDILTLEDEILRKNKNEFNMRRELWGQGDEHLGPEEIVNTVNEFGIYPLFHKYAIDNLINYFKKLKMDENTIVNLSELYLHSQRVSYKNEYDKDKAMKIKKEQSC